MTQDELRELDRQVAKALGWTWDSKTATSPTGSRNARNEGDPWWWLPHYSSRIEDAWIVWEQLDKIYTGRALLLGRPAIKSYEDFPAVYLGTPGMPIGTGDTYQEAICRAFLGTENWKPGRWNI